MAEDNLISLKVINCLRCYDSGWIQDPFGQAEPVRCPCGQSWTARLGDSEAQTRDWAQLAELGRRING